MLAEVLQQARSDGLVGYGASLTCIVSSLEVPSSILGSIISFSFCSSFCLSLFMLPRENDSLLNAILRRLFGILEILRQQLFILACNYYMPSKHMLSIWSQGHIAMTEGSYIQSS